MFRNNVEFSSQLESDLEHNDRSHVVSKKREPPVELRDYRRRESSSKLFYASDRRLIDSSITTGILYRTDFNSVWKLSSPRTIGVNTAARVRKTEQSQFCIRLRLIVDKPWIILPNARDRIGHCRSDFLLFDCCDLKRRAPRVLLPTSF